MVVPDVFEVVAHTEPKPEEVDDFVKKNHLDDVDFIKIDIDGEDLCALFSCESNIDPYQILGFELEKNILNS